MTALEEVGELWNVAAQRDAMGYILTTGQPWDIDTFLAHGRGEIADCFRRLDALGLRGSRTRRALDFGCGIGRLTQALADYYGRVDGVDVAPAMIVLQHMPQEYALQYIRDFIRLLHPEGIAVFEIPDGPDAPHGDACLSMYGTPRATVEQVVRDAGGEVVDVELLPVECQWKCYRYTARRA